MVLPLMSDKGSEFRCLNISLNKYNLKKVMGKRNRLNLNAIK